MLSASLIISFLTRLTSALSKGIMLTLVVPLGIALIFNIPTIETLGLIGSTLLIEYGAAPVGIALGLPAVFVIFVLSCVALGVIVALFDIFDSIGDHSERIQNFLERTRKQAAESVILARYGIYGLIIIVLTLGFYICPAVAWVCGWDRKRSILFTMAGYVIFCAIMIVITGDIMSLLFPQP